VRPSPAQGDPGLRCETPSALGEFAVSQMGESGLGATGLASALFDNSLRSVAFAGVLDRLRRCVQAGVGLSELVVLAM
jgi:hypothetical protein